MKHRLLVLVVATVALAVVACGSNTNTNGKPAATGSSAAAATRTASTPGGKVGGTLTFAAEFEPDSVNPLINDDESNFTRDILFRGLTLHDKENKVQPDLAKSWDVSPDSLTYTFHLRDGVKWHDGQPFTADDVKFSIDAIRDKNNSSSSFQKFELVKSVEIVDPMTVRFTLQQPYAPFLDKLTQGLAPKKWFHNSSSRRLRQMIEQARVRKATWISARRS